MPLKRTVFPPEISRFSRGAAVQLESNLKSAGLRQGKPAAETATSSQLPAPVRGTTKTCRF